MMKIKHIGIFLLGLLAMTFLSVVSAKADVRIGKRAVSCGWFVVSGCERKSARSKRRIARRARKIGGRVINTSSRQYPNFRSGYYCAMIGPIMHYQNAANRSLRHKDGPGSYVKNACRANQKGKTWRRDDVNPRNRNPRTNQSGQGVRSAPSCGGLTGMAKYCCQTVRSCHRVQTMAPTCAPYLCR